MSTALPEVSRGTFWRLDRVAAALESLATTRLPRGAAVFGRVWTDTRTIEPGDLFVALVGERFDAHDFLAAAVAKGAAGVVVSRAAAARGLGVPAFPVHDTLAALGALGRYHRRAMARPVVAVVGTNGKTSTKELLRAALGSMLEVHATTANLNNLVGAPLTLLAMPEGIDVAVVELGTNSPGEVARLRDIVEPNITVVTSIAEEHLEGLGDVAGVMREELAACDGVMLAVVPASQPEVAAAARGRAQRLVAAGLGEGDFSAPAWGIDPDGIGWLEMDGIQLRSPLRGAHNLRNMALALAVARELGVSMADAARGLASMPVPPMRSNLEHLGPVTLINDAYNSNPGSAYAALDLLAHAGKGRQRVAVLATMLELGSATPKLHDEVARAALGGEIEIVAGIGEFAAALARVGSGDARIVTADTVESLWARLSSRLARDAVILLKGSRGMRLERLVAPITAWADGARQ
jgi:UDP-N-acetylmuramoyl-tripeptide--D-alanyl-D-alanine ligase